MNNGKYLIKNKFVAIADSNMVEGEKALIAEKDLPKNSIIFLYEAPSTTVRTRTSIQVLGLNEVVQSLLPPSSTMIHHAIFNHACT